MISGVPGSFWSARRNCSSADWTSPSSLIMRPTSTMSRTSGLRMADSCVVRSSGGGGSAGVIRSVSNMVSIGGNPAGTVVELASIGSSGAGRRSARSRFPMSSRTTANPIAAIWASASPAMVQNATRSVLPERGGADTLDGGSSGIDFGDEKGWEKASIIGILGAGVNLRVDTPADSGKKLRQI